MSAAPIDILPGGRVLRLVIRGAPVTKKNSMRIMRGRNGGRFVAQSVQSVAWEDAAVLQLRSQARGHRPLAVPVNMRAHIYRARDTGDLLNYLAAVSDALEVAGVVEDDKLVTSVDGSRMFIDRAGPRVEVVLTW